MKKFYLYLPLEKMYRQEILKGIITKLNRKCLDVRVREEGKAIVFSGQKEKVNKAAAEGIQIYKSYIKRKFTKKISFDKAPCLSKYFSQIS